MSSRSDIKRDVFYDLLDLTGRAFVLVRYSKNVVIGRRGFTDEEKKNGIVLVFNNNMQFTWDTDGIHASLVFSGVQEKCYVPAKDIIAVYSPEAKVQLTVDPEHEMHSEPFLDEQLEEHHEHHKPVHVDREGKIIKVDFGKRGEHWNEDEDNNGDDKPA